MRLTHAALGVLSLGLEGLLPALDKTRLGDDGSLCRVRRRLQPIKSVSAGETHDRQHTLMGLCEFPVFHFEAGSLAPRCLGGIWCLGHMPPVVNGMGKLTL